MPTSTRAKNMAATAASRQQTMARKKAIMDARKKAGQPAVQTKAQIKNQAMRTGPARPGVSPPMRPKAPGVAPPRRPRAGPGTAPPMRPSAPRPPRGGRGAMPSPPPMKTPAPNPAAKRAALAKPMAPRGGIQPLKGK